MSTTHTNHVSGGSRRKLTGAWWTKLSILIVTLLFAVAYVIPTIGKLNTDDTWFPVKKKVNLGLDLQGGLYMLFGVDIPKVYKDVLQRQVEGLKTTLSAKGIDVEVKVASAATQIAVDPRFDVSFDAKNHDAIYEQIKGPYANLRIVDDKPNSVGLSLAREYRDEIKQSTLGQSIQVIRNRIDEFGVTEPAITSQGDSRVVVELPGIKEVERAKQLVGRTAKLEFRIADERAMSPNELMALVSKIEKDNGLSYKEGTRFSDYVTKINELAKGKIPEGHEIFFERKTTFTGDDFTPQKMPFLLNARADVTGQDLQDAHVGIDHETQSPIVEFELNPAGATRFEELTGSHIGEKLAIVLDGIVHSAPVINSKIGARGQISLGRGQGEDIMKEAKDLAIVLRAGALPAQLELLEQRVIGPSLGADSIKEGVTAGVVGCLLIFVFMLFYYRASGAVAVFSLVLNGVFALAILVALEATLTLPGIAGLALTIGMAVDSNVIIFERIRDELEEGKDAVTSIETGFQKAFTSIFDANITHAIVAIVLLNYGTGPIKGFAVTLLIGIVTTLFTAVTVCKLVFDGYIAMKRGQIAKLSI